MEETNDLIALRRQKMETLRQKGVEPFGARFDTSGTISELYCGKLVLLLIVFCAFKYPPARVQRGPEGT